MKSFDEWWKTEGLNTFDYPKEAAESGFEAGQQSKQAEVDELREMVRMLVDNTIVAVDDALENQANDLLKGDQS